MQNSDASTDLCESIGDKIALIDDIAQDSGPGQPIKDCGDVDSALGKEGSGFSENLKRFSANMVCAVMGKKVGEKMNGPGLKRYAPGVHFKSPSGKILSQEISNGIGMKGLHSLTNGEEDPAKSKLSAINAVKKSNARFGIFTDVAISRVPADPTKIQLRLAGSIIDVQSGRFAGAVENLANVTIADKACQDQVNKYFDSRKSESSKGSDLPDCLKGFLTKSDNSFTHTSHSGATSSVGAAFGRSLRMKIRSLKNCSREQDPELSDPKSMADRQELEGRAQKLRDNCELDDFCQKKGIQVPKARR